MNRADALTDHFYSWERRLRGWETFAAPVDLEPTFEPFLYHDVVPKEKIVDDSFRPSVITRIGNAIKSFLPPDTSDDVVADVYEPPEPFYIEQERDLTALAVSLPVDYKVQTEAIEQLLFSLSSLDDVLSFEIIATSAAIRLQFVCATYYSGQVYNQIKAFFPACGIHEASITDAIQPDSYYWSVDLGLCEECVRPLAMHRNFDIDPLTSIFALLENLSPGEQIVFQVLFKATLNPWAGSMIRSVTDHKGESFFSDAPEMVKLCQEKIASPLCAVVIRVNAFSSVDDATMFDRTVEAIKQAMRSSTNTLIELAQMLSSDDVLADIYFRTSHRPGMLLNIKELTGIVHFPSQSIHSQKLLRDTKKTKRAPAIFHNHKLLLGINTHQGNSCNVTISAEQRLKHVHIIGATGTGKSSLLFSSIVQDIANGEGIAVLDPHGDLIEAVQCWIHPDRHEDVIIIDPSDAEYPVGFNILTAHSEIEKDILSSDLVAVFRRLSTSWGDQMNSVFANAILAFLESSKGGTLIDLRRFLIEKEFREQFLSTVSDPSIVYYWKKEFPIVKSNSIGPILTRLDSFLRPKVIRNMVAQNKSLDFEWILDNKKIVLVKLSQGLIGAENSYLLGTFLVSKLQQAAMARQSKSKTARSNFYLYVDEFQNFITPSMSAILSGARKYHLGLVLVHQDMQQVNKADAELASSVTANAGTRICFRLGDTDAKRFENGFSFFDSADLQNLDTGEAIIRIERPENDCNVTTLPLYDLDEDTALEIKERVINLSRQHYGTPKADVEAFLREMHTGYEQQQEKPTSNPIVAPPQRAPIKRDVQEPQISTPIIQVPTQGQQERKQETQHRYLQALVKRMAEARGFTASIEEPTPDGKGKVDVVLTRNGKRIAVEINDTSKDGWELHNIEKCLAANFDIIIPCSNDSKVVARMMTKIETKFNATDVKKIRPMTPDTLFLFLDSEIAKEASTETRYKGFRVKVDYSAVSDEEMNRKRDAIARSMINVSK